MAFYSCRDEILLTVNILISTKKKNEFTIKEVIQLMVKSKTIFKESTIRTHISSRCCINSPKNHLVVYNDFERIGHAVYKYLD